MPALPILAITMILAYPGAPGGPEEAKEFLATLASYLEQKAGLPSGSLEIDYENDLDEAAKKLQNGEGSIAVATLPALCASGSVPYRYLGSPLLGGEATEVFSLVTLPGKAAKGALQEVAVGKRIAGTTLRYRRFVERLVLPGIAFDVEPTETAIEGWNMLREGNADLLLLSRTELESLSEMLDANAFALVAKTSPLPGAPLISLGSPGEGRRGIEERIAAAFERMCSDPDGADLCDTMDVSGFVSNRGKDLAAALERCWE